MGLKFINLKLLFDKIGWIIEGLVPLIIPGIIFIWLDSLIFINFVGFVGSIAFVQLLPGFVNICSKDRSETYKLFYRIDNVFRLALFCGSLLYFLLEGYSYIFIWISVVLLIFSIISQFSMIGRLRVTTASLFGRTINYIYILSIGIPYSDEFALISMLNGFITGF
jgi:hypothetical protein